MNQIKKENKCLLSDESRQNVFADRYLNKSKRIVSRCFQELDSLPGAPQEYKYFLDILKKVFIENELISYKENEKYVASFCTMIPNEIIRAAGARPIMMCSSSYVGLGAFNERVPSTVCPHIRAICFQFLISKISLAVFMKHIMLSTSADLN